MDEEGIRDSVGVWVKISLKSALSGLLYSFKPDNSLSALV
jgi:hypothetical protein